MLIDAREVPDDAVLRSAVCVIGAGAAGITITRELGIAGIDVLLLESGGLEPDADTTALNEGDITGEPLDPINPLALVDTRLRYFGGTTNHWSGWCRPFEPVDFETRSWVPDSGWPFGREILDPYYERAQPIIGLGPFRYDWQYWDERYGTGAPLFDDGPFRTSVLQINQESRFGVRYQDELASAPTVRVCLWANVTEIVLADDGTRVASLDVATVSGRRFRVVAGVTVLATGGVEVPRLLLASTGVRPAGVGNEHDLVGRYFTEHPNVVAGNLVVDGAADAFALYGEQPVPGAGPPGTEVLLRGTFLAGAEAMSTHSLLGSEITFPIGGPATLLERAANEEVAARDVAELLAAETGHEPGTFATTRLLCEQAPNPDSRVVLTAERDQLGVPRVALEWRLQRIDRESIVRTLGVFALDLARRGSGRAQVVVPGAEADVSTGLVVEPDGRVVLADGVDLDYGLGTGFHHMGTARMHPDPTRGVVDADCRVHSVADLYVAGSAVFPTCSSAPPTLTLTALALRLADHLRTRVLP